MPVLDKRPVKPSLLTVKRPATRSTSLPFSVHNTDETGGLAQISQLRIRSAESSTETSADPESSGGSTEELEEKNKPKCDYFFGHSSINLLFSSCLAASSPKFFVQYLHYLSSTYVHTVWTSIFFNFNSLTRTQTLTSCPPCWLTQSKSQHLYFCHLQPSLSPITHMCNGVYGAQFHQLKCSPKPLQSISCVSLMVPYSNYWILQTWLWLFFNICFLA